MDLVGTLLANPVALGALITVGLNWGKEALQAVAKKIDKEKLAEPFSKHLHLVMLVSTFLASAAKMASEGHLGDMNFQAVIDFIQVYLPMLIGAKAMKLGK